MPAAEPLTIVRLHSDRVPQGFSAWRVPPGGAVVVMPAPADDAPVEFWERYLLRAAANSVGVCPSCEQRAGLNLDPEHRAAWQVMELVYGIKHLAECPALFTEADRRFFDPRALGGQP